MRRRVVLAILIIPALTGAWMAWVVTTTYLKAPGIVAKLDREGLLAFSPRDLPRERRCALLFVQDPTFYRHQGIGIASGHLGHTTITQAIGKALLFDGFSPGPLRLNKIRLILAAWGFDRRIPKETQLRLFLNLSGRRADPMWLRRSAILR
jgi:hypothetical protein